MAPDGDDESPPSCEIDWDSVMEPPSTFSSPDVYCKVAVSNALSSLPSELSRAIAEDGVLRMSLREAPRYISAASAFLRHINYRRVMKRTVDICSDMKLLRFTIHSRFQDVTAVLGREWAGEKGERTQELSLEALRVMQDTLRPVSELIMLAYERGSPAVSSFVEVNLTHDLVSFFASAEHWNAKHLLSVLWADTNHLGVSVAPH